MDWLAEMLALVEVGIDFSDEDVTFLGGEALQRRISELDVSLADLIDTSARFERLSHEPTFVLVGRPNAGKSTLLNALAGHDRAIVSPVAGTTRDALSADVRLERGIVRLIDVAGLEDAVADHPIERQMRSRAVETVESADHVVLVQDLTDATDPPAIPRPADLIVYNKIDLTDDVPANVLAVSAATGANLPELRRRLNRLAFGDSALGASLALNARHLAAITDARNALARATDVAHDAGAELIALELRDALDALGQVLGQVSPDDVLGRVFSTFCIGK
jgi:tRNA modification GTPase